MGFLTIHVSTPFQKEKKILQLLSGHPCRSCSCSFAKRPLQICQESMATPQIRSLHELHTNRMKWFCLDCAAPQVDEVEAVKHYFSVHVKTAKQEATARGILFRPIHYQLRCPFDECRQLLSTPKGLRLHLNKMHRAATTSSST
ncbi:unnamed protein product [Angiostrongylus costaricensis]|uniref:C2H2-type domain-containing protein n=1 Tax=Angiostrongylus costaricensis TaxID=334426 RepID=A0A0R3Q2S3_ANGCS|nr:unnamed protein product [Angiostrongylus costaricensis]